MIARGGWVVRSDVCVCIRMGEGGGGKGCSNLSQGKYDLHATPSNGMTNSNQGFPKVPSPDNCPDICRIFRAANLEEGKKDIMILVFREG